MREASRVLVYAIFYLNYPNTFFKKCGNLHVLVMITPTIQAATAHVSRNRGPNEVLERVENHLGHFWLTITPVGNRTKSNTVWYGLRY